MIFYIIMIVTQKIFLIIMTDNKNSGYAFSVYSE